MALFTIIPISIFDSDKTIINGFFRKKVYIIAGLHGLMAVLSDTIKQSLFNDH